MERKKGIEIKLRAAETLKGKKGTKRESRRVKTNNRKLRGKTNSGTVRSEEENDSKKGGEAWRR